MPELVNDMVVLFLVSCLLANGSHADSIPDNARMTLSRVPVDAPISFEAQALQARLLICDNLPIQPDRLSPELHRAIRSALPLSAQDFVVDYIAKRFAGDWISALSMMGNELLNPDRWDFLDRCLDAGLPITVIADFLHYKEFDLQMEYFPEWFVDLILKNYRFKEATHDLKNAGIHRNVISNLWAMFWFLRRPFTQAIPATSAQRLEMAALRCLKNERFPYMVQKIKAEMEALGRFPTDHEIITQVLSAENSSRHVAYLNMAPSLGRKKHLSYPDLTNGFPDLRLEHGELPDRPGFEGIHMWLTQSALLEAVRMEGVIPAHAMGNALLVGTFVFRLEDKNKTLINLLKQSWSRSPTASLSAVAIEKCLENVLRRHAQESGIERIRTWTGSQYFHHGATQLPLHRHTIQRLNNLNKLSGYDPLYHAHSWWWLKDFSRNETNNKVGAAA